MQKIRYKKLVDSIFLRDIYVVIGSNEEVVPFLQKRFGDSDGVDEENDDANFITYRTGYVIWFAKLDETPASYNTISHEVFHAAWNILTSIGLVLSEDSEESFAYYAGSLTEQIVKFARK